MKVWVLLRFTKIVFRSFSSFIHSYVATPYMYVCMFVVCVSCVLGHPLILTSFELQVGHVLIATLE